MSVSVCFLCVCLSVCVCGCVGVKLGTRKEVTSKHVCSFIQDINFCYARVFFLC